MMDSIKTNESYVQMTPGTPSHRRRPSKTSCCGGHTAYLGKFALLVLTVVGLAAVVSRHIAATRPADRTYLRQIPGTAPAATVFASYGAELDAKCPPSGETAEDHPAALWRRAATSPRLCVPRLDPRGDFAPAALQQALLAQCGAWCVSHPGHAGGWHLHGTGCWEAFPDMALSPCRAYARVSTPGSPTAVVPAHVPTPTRAKTGGCDRIGTKGVCGPQLLIGGAMKCGTNTLSSILRRHPDVERAGRGRNFESHFFTHDSMGRGRDPYSKAAQDWLVGTLGLDATSAPGKVTFEQSPSYLSTHLHPWAPKLVHDILPSAKVLFTVCDPAERFFSEWRHLQKEYEDATADGKPLADDLRMYAQFTELYPSEDSFATLVAQLQDGSALDKQHHDLFLLLRARLDQGLYGEHLASWRQQVSPDQIKVVRMEELKQEKHVRDILAFAGLPAASFPWADFAAKAQRVAFKNTHYGGRKTLGRDYPGEAAWLKDYFKAGGL